MLFGNMYSLVIDKLYLDRILFMKNTPVQNISYQRKIFVLHEFGYFGVF